MKFIMECFYMIVSAFAAVSLITHILGYLIPTIAFIYSSLCLSIKFLIFLGAALIGILTGLDLDPYVPKRIKRQPNDLIVSKTKERLADLKFPPGKIKTTPLVSRNVDDVIEELISLLFRDYISSWYSYVVKHPSLFCKQLKDPIRQMLFTFRDRCQKISEIELITSDIVNILTDHMQRIRFSVVNPAEKIQPYMVFKFLSSKEAELDHLRCLCEFLLATLLPPDYVDHLTLKSLLREIFTVSVFYPIIDKLCDPDFINMKLISYLKQQQLQAEKHRKLYAYAETYEDFIKMIQESFDIEDLRRMRYYIATEIMQATTMSNLKRSKGIDADKEFKPQKTNKGDLLQARDLSRYLNQLQFAKAQCEKRLKGIGGAEYISINKSGNGSSNKSVYMPGQKVLSMSVIMQSSFCRRHFSRFLQKEESHSLLGFWEAVDEMKHSDKDSWHKLGNEIVQIYVHHQSSSVRLNKSTLKGIEEFMMANKGPEAFFQAQEEIYRFLEEHYYASFIVSDVYHKMLAEVEKQGIDFMQEQPEEVSELQIPDEDPEIDKMPPDTSDVSVFDHSSYARSQLKVLTEKIGYKKQALDALRNNTKCEKKVILMMEKEIADLVLEQNMLENHIEKTELWIEFLGVWQASIMEAMEKKENEKIVPYFVIRVHLASDAEFVPNKMSGWVVSRSLQSFHSLHQKLVPAAMWLKKIDLPTKPRFKSLDRNYLERAKKCLQTFLSAVTKDDGLNKSEALYDFLSPSPEYMKHPPVPPKRPFKLNLLQFFKGIPQTVVGTLQNTLNQFDDPVDEELLFLDDSDSKDDKKDSIAEPLYVLIGEIFELKGVFNWLRKSLITFVQITYGSTINRQLRETVSYILSEPMLLFYLQLFRDTMWPPDKQVLNVEERSVEKKLETKHMAKEMFLNNPPVILNKLIGEQNTRKGLSKVFDALQNQYFNKQLFYKILEAFIYAYAPELKQISSLYSIDKAESCSE
ncbi:sorting nexin-25 isoform X1 [Parasteatoda tepidariorum]|uniref:sorting nexin-25 isoform X1 n=1 Tax=Parasteatoda tepidariorum TaxID=114398 RepID=UPI001C72706C|nr:sorting nexin-25 isoform X4 [Parasteatoda tepidariorum]